MTDLRQPQQNRGLTYTGRAISAVVVAALSASASMKFLQNPGLVESMVGHFGYPPTVLLPVAITELLCTLLYAVPATTTLGAILITGYLGGATATHVRVGEPPLAPILLGILAWLGLFLRDPRLRHLLRRNKI